MDETTHGPFHLWDDPLRRRLIAGAQRLSLRTGKVLFYQADLATKTYLVLAGTIRTTMYRTDESSLDLGIRGAGDWLGLPEFVLGGPYLADAVALEALGCLAFDRSAFDRIRAAPGGEAWLSTELARQCYSLHARIEVAQPGQRLARWLMGHGSGPIVCTQEEVASAVGTTRETVNRHLGRMQAEGLVKLDRGRLTVLEPDGLAGWGGE